jgi:hypothetical protein
MTTIRIGADPEGFIVDKAGTFIPATGIIPGDKHNPYKIEHGAVQVDGVAVEFNIDPAENEEEFNRNVVAVTQQIDTMIKKVDKDYTVSWTPVARFRKDIWTMIPEDNKVLGCDPDFNIEGQVNINPTEALEGDTLRTAAGHIHIGFRDELIDNPMEADHFEDCLYFAREFHKKGLSLYTPHTEEEQERLIYYGHSGSFRPKKYGVELRAPSNLWVGREETRRLIFNQTRNTFRELIGL